MRAYTLTVIASALLVCSPAGCGDDGTAASLDPSACERNGTNEVILDNHPRGSHELEVPLDDVASGVEVIYDIQGSNTGHGHSVTVAEPDFAAMEDGELVELRSSDTGAVGMDHAHGIRLDCIAR